MKEDTRSRYVKYVKVCFLAIKGKQHDIEPASFWAFSTDRNDAFLPFHILQLVKSLPVFIPEA